MHTLSLSLLAASLLAIQETPKTPVAKSEDYESQLEALLVDLALTNEALRARSGSR